MTVTPQRTRPHMAAYGISADETGILDWAWADERLRTARNYWLSTTRPNGLPHAAPIWAVWEGGALVFAVDGRSVKGRNLRAQPEVVVHLESGDDVVILEGWAAVLTDVSGLAPLRPAYIEKYGVDGFDTTAEESSHYLYVRVTPRVVLAWREADFTTSAARFTFPAG